MGKTIQGYWDCPYCGTVGISGTERICPGCGRPRGTEVTFYMKDKTEYIDKKEGGPDWLCSFCETLNSGQDTVCKSCGATREESQKNYFDLHPERREQLTGEEAMESSTEKKKKEIQNLTDEKVNAASPGTRSGKRNPLIFALPVLLLFLIFFVLPLGSKKASITGFAWYRSTAIETNTRMEESGWTLPQDATLIKEKKEVHHYNQILDHYQDVQKTREVVVGSHTEVTGYKDNGDGSFEEITEEVPDYETETYTEKEPVYVPVPVYATKYYYEIYRYQVTDHAAASGQDHQAVWPDYNLNQDQREGEKEEDYYFTIKAKKKEYIYSTDFDTWTGLKEGQPIKMKGSLTSQKLYDEDGNLIKAVRVKEMRK